MKTSVSKSFRWIVAGALSVLLLAPLVTFMVGCNLLGSHFSDGVELGHAGSPPTTGSADVRFQIVFPRASVPFPASAAMAGADATADIRCIDGITPSIRASAQTTVQVRLILVFPGADAKNQKVVLSKQVPVDANGRAEASFTGVPATSVIGEIKIRNGSLGGKTDFHGAADLIDGKTNNILLAPVGTGDPIDLAATVLHSVLSMPELLAAVNSSIKLVDTIRTTLPTTSDGEPSSVDQVQKAINGFVTTVPVTPTLALTKIAITTEGGLQTEPGAPSAWNVTPQQLWDAIGDDATGRGFQAVRVLRQGLGAQKPPLVAFVDSMHIGFAIAMIDPENGSIDKYLLNDDAGAAGGSLTHLSAAVTPGSGNSVIFGAVTQSNLPVLLRWSGNSSGKAGWPLDGSGLLQWGSEFPGIVADSRYPNPEVAHIIMDASGNGDAICLVRDPRSLMLRDYQVTAAGVVTPVQVFHESEEPQPWPLTAIPASGSVTLHWDAVPGAETYTVFWQRSPFTAADRGQATMVARAGRPFTHLGLENGTPYYYLMTWHSGDSEQGVSHVVAATPVVGPDDTVEQYRLVYDGNEHTGGTAPVDARTYLEDDEATILNNTGQLERTGFTFAGWNTQADGQGTSYAAGATFQIGAANVTLYAQWAPNPTYNVIYVGNDNSDGAIPTDSNNYEQNATVTVKGNSGNLVKTGFTFAGWNTQADGQGTSYAAGATFQIGAADVTLYAQWAIFAGGEGTEESPYLVANATQLDRVRDFLTAHFRQIADIDLGVAPWNEGEGWNPIGIPNASAVPPYSFKGVYDGNNCKISNLFINRNDDVQGLFGSVVPNDGQTAQIRNVKLVDVDVSGKNNAGALAGSLKNTLITNCHATGKVTVSATRAAGLVGSANVVTIENSTTNVEVSGPHGGGDGVYIGGLLGYIDSYPASSISNCRADGPVTGDYAIGGLCGSAKGVVITNCHTTGEVSGSNYGIGGLIGYAPGSIEVVSCSATGEVIGVERHDGYIVKQMGGLIGYMDGGIVRQSHATGAVTGNGQVGGLIGHYEFKNNRQGEIVECFASGAVSGRSNKVGGLIGHVSGLIGVGQPRVSDCYATGVVTGHASVGGLCGYWSANITRCYSTGAAHAGKDQPVGGLLGDKLSGDCTSSFWDTETSGRLTSAGGTGKSTQEMKQQSTFTDEGWDFGTVWAIAEGAGYPTLRRQ